VTALRTDLARQPDVAVVSQPQYSQPQYSQPQYSQPQYSQAQNAAVLTVIPRTSPQDSRTSTLVRDLRETVVPQATARTGVTALIGGPTAARRSRYCPPAPPTA
jgi:putative drug exporter of the RND superfamily